MFCFEFTRDNNEWKEREQMREGTTNDGGRWRFQKGLRLARVRALDGGGIGLSLANTTEISFSPSFTYLQSSHAAFTQHRGLADERWTDNAMD